MNDFAPAPVNPVVDAVVMMESTGLAPQVRGLSSAWSRLYQAGEVLVDLTLSRRTRGLRLEGTVLRRDGHDTQTLAATLIGDGVGQVLTLEPDGYFSTDLDDGGAFDLRLVLSDVTVRVANLRIG